MAVLRGQSVACVAARRDFEAVAHRRIYALDRRVDANRLGVRDAIADERLRSPRNRPGCDVEVEDLELPSGVDFGELLARFRLARRSLPFELATLIPTRHKYPDNVEHGQDEQGGSVRQ